MTFVDTNILLYAVSGAPEDGVKKAIARSILRGELLTFSIQVLQEFYVQATRSTRHDPLSHEEAADLIRL
jgi:predicted nucleic acid-binding protein